MAPERPGPLARRRRPPARAPERPPGWRVEGGREPAAPGGGGRRINWRRMAGVLLILLGLNWFVVSLLPDGEKRIDVPYTFFREQVQAGNVAEVTSRGDTIQGTFREAVDPADAGETGKPGTDFETERPAFADDELLSLLVDQKVVVNAEPIDEGRSLVLTLLLSFGPVILIFVVFALLMRRAAGAAGRSPRSAARAPSATTRARGGSRSTTSPGSRRPRRSWSRSSTSSATRTATAASAARSPAACCSRGRPAPARRCWRARSPARRTCPSSRSPPRSSSR
jgi:cell division protease FtsH